MDRRQKLESPKNEKVSQMKKAFLWTMLALAILCACSRTEERSVNAAPAAAAANPDADFDLERFVGSRYYGVYLGGKRCGRSVMKLEKLQYNDKPAYRTSMEMELNIAVMGASHTMNVVESTTFYAAGQMAECLSSLGAAGSFHGVVQGDQIKLTSNLGGAKTERMLPAPTNTLADETAVLRLITGGPAVGDSVDCPTFDATHGRTLKATATVTAAKKIPYNGIPTDVYEVSVSIPEMALNSPMLVGSDAEVLRIELPVGTMKLIMRREDEEEAKNSSLKFVEVLGASMIRPKGKMPDLSKAQSLRLQLTGITDQECIINDSRQSYTKTDAGYELLAQKDTLPEEPARIPIKEAGVQEFLKATHFYQCDHPDIVAQAKEIVGDETDAYKASFMICHWVFGNVKKKGTATISNALETLNTMEGDCGEHAALFVGLCRAVGLPARVATGLAYASPYRAFGGHAWCEVYVGKWISVDPTFGQPLADPGHIKVVAGDGDIDSYRMLGAISKLKITVLPPKEE